MPDLGYRPPGGWNINLGRGSDFVQTLTRKDGLDWPAGTIVTLVIGTYASWAATITGPQVSWNVDKTLVDALADATSEGRLATKITCHADGLDLTWVTGRVNWFSA